MCKFADKINLEKKKRVSSTTNYVTNHLKAFNTI